MTSHPYGLRKRGKIWHYRFVVGEIPFASTTRTENLAEAKEIAEAVYREVVRGAVGLKGAPKLSALVEEWIRAHRKVHSTAHMDIATFALEALGSVADLPLPSLTTTRMTAWRTAYLADHAPATANLVLRYLGAWCRFAMAHGYLQGMPYTLKPVRFQQAPRPVLKPEQVQAFLAGVDRDPNTVTKGTPNQLEADARRRAQVRAAVRFMLGLGLREAEVLGARWEWLQQGSYTVGKAKGKRSRVIPVPAWVAAALADLPRADLGLMFPGEEGAPHPQGWLRKAIGRGCKAVGLPVVGPHRLRATFITLHAHGGTPLRLVQEMAGHRDIKTTMGYVEDDFERRVLAQDNMATILGFG